jgi:hypothetical protein
MYRRPASPIPQRVRHEGPAQDVRSAIERMAHSHADSNSNSAASAQPFSTLSDPAVDAACRRAWVNRTAEHLSSLQPSEAHADSSTTNVFRIESPVTQVARAQADACYTEASSAAPLPAFASPQDADTFRVAWITRMAENFECAVSDTDTRGASTSASRHHQDRSLPRSLPPPRPRTSLGRATPTYPFFWVPLIYTVLQCMKRGLTRPQIMLSTGRLPSTLRCCLCYGTLPVGSGRRWRGPLGKHRPDICRRFRQTRNYPAFVRGMGSQR